MTTIRPYREDDLEPVLDLWQRCGLTRPWNDARTDIGLCLATPSSVLFVAAGPAAGDLRATVMAGSDGHRGWLYYRPSTAPGAVAASEGTLWGTPRHGSPASGCRRWS